MRRQQKDRDWWGQQKDQQWKSQQKGQVECVTCGEHVPKGNYPIHAVRCGYKKQSKILQKENRLSQILTRSGKRKGISRVERRYKIFSKQNQKKQDLQQKIPCSFCGYKQSFSELDTHPGRCEGRQDICTYCGQMYPKQLMQQHKEVCPEKQVSDDDEELFGQEQQQQYEQEQENSSPRRGRHRQSSSSINSLMGLLSLIDNMRVNMNVLLRDLQMEQNSHGLSQQKQNQLKKFRYKQSKQQQLCTICYCKMETGQQCIELKCRHMYHTECITKWLQQSSKCPVCKRDQNDDNR